MSMKTISRVILAALVVVAVAALLSPANATAGHWGMQIMDQTGCKHYQECDHCCKLEAEQVETSKTCFEVECKTICIPRVVFPWQKKKCSSCDSCDGQGCNNCVHNGARTRTIKVLKSSKKPGCPACEYTWTAEKKGCAVGSCCGAAACDCDGAATGGAVPVEQAAVSVPQRLPVPTTR